MSKAQSKTDNTPFYEKLLAEFNSLSNGDKASIRKTVEPDDLQLNPVFYRLIQAALSETEAKGSKEFFKDLAKIARLVYFLPFIQDASTGKTLGALFRVNGISERRLFLVMRSEYPQDLIQLRRLCQQLKPKAVLDWPALAELFAWWGKDKSRSERSKQTLMRDFYLPLEKKPDEDSAPVDLPGL